MATTRPTTSGCEAAPECTEAAAQLLQAAALLEAAATLLEAPAKQLEAAAKLLEAAAGRGGGGGGGGCQAAALLKLLEAAAKLIEAAAKLLEAAARLPCAATTKPSRSGSLQHPKHLSSHTQNWQTFRLHDSHHTRVLRPRAPQWWQQPEAMARSRRARNLGWLSGNSP